MTNLKLGIYKKDNTLSRVLDLDEKNRLSEPLELQDDESNTVWIAYNPDSPPQPMPAHYFIGR